MHDVSNRDTHLYPQHNNPLVHVTTTEVRHFGRITVGLWIGWTVPRDSALSSPQSVPIARDVTKGGARREQFPGWRITMGAPKSPSNVTSILFKTVHLLPTDLRFEHGGAKLASCPGRHLTSLRPCPSPWNVPAKNSAGLAYPPPHRCRTFSLLLNQMGYGFLCGLWVWRRRIKPWNIFPFTVRSIDHPMQCMAWRFWMMRQSNDCSTPPPISSAAK